jgi:hypothetical protein
MSHEFPVNVRGHGSKVENFGGTSDGVAGIHHHDHNHHSMTAVMA